MQAGIESELISQINTAAESVYGALTAQTGNTSVHQRGICIQASVAMKLALEELGIVARLRSSPLFRNPSSFHDTCFIPDENGDGIVIDLTWQQFLPEPDDRLPKVLICKLSNLPTTLTSLGIPADKHRYWLYVS